MLTLYDCNTTLQHVKYTSYTYSRNITLQHSRCKRTTQSDISAGRMKNIRCRPMTQGCTSDAGSECRRSSIELVVSRKEIMYLPITKIALIKQIRQDCPAGIPSPCDSTRIGSNQSLIQRKNDPAYANTTDCRRKHLLTHKVSTH